MRGLLRRVLSAPVRRLMGVFIRGGRFGEWFAWRIIRGAQRRVERLAFAQRRSVLVQDEWIEESLAFAKAGPE